MPEYFYTATNANSEVEKDSMIAPDEATLKSNLLARGLTVTDVRVAESTSPAAASSDLTITWFDKLQGVKMVDKLFFTQNLQVMVRTGFSISNALKTLSLQTRNKYFKKIILIIVNDVEAGTSLAESMRRFPKVFQPTFTSMVATGEATGQLENVLDRLSLQMKKDHQILSKVRGAMIYPAIILSAMVAIGIAMLVFVIPKITELYEEADVDLPLPTRILIGISNFIQGNGLIVILSAIVLIVAFTRFIRSKRGRVVWHATLLKTPIAGRIIRLVNLSRFMRTLNSLISTDIPIVKAFEIISDTLGNTQYKNVMLKVSQAVKRGSGIAPTLTQWPSLFPPVVTQIIQVGEQSGTLDEITGHVAEFYEEEIDQTMSNLATVIEPVLMLILGVGVGGIAVAIVSPMYNLVNTI